MGDQSKQRLSGRGFVLLSVLLVLLASCVGSLLIILALASTDVGQRIIAAASEPTLTPLVPTVEPVEPTATTAAQAGQIELEAQIEAVYESVGPGVVNITSRSLEYDFFLNPVPREGTGSGFFYDDQGRIVTNFHVIQGAQELQVTLADGRQVPAQVLGSDPSTDLAVLQVEVSPEEALAPPVGDSTALRVGQFMVAIGNPFGLERTLTVGVVSSLGRVIESPNERFIGEVIQTDAPINPGNSGGPLLNLAGEVIGVNSAILSPSGTSAGIGFAIPARTVQRIIPRLISDGSFPHPSLGINVFELTPQRARVLEQAGQPVGVERGLLIVELESGGAAEQAGLRAGQQLAQLGNVIVPLDGDLLTAINGEPIETERDMILYLETNTEVGQTVAVTIIRDGQEQTLPVVVGELAMQEVGVR